MLASERTNTKEQYFSEAWLRALLNFRQSRADNRFGDGRAPLDFFFVLSSQILGRALEDSNNRL